MKRVFDRIVILISFVSLALCAVAFVDFLLHPLAGDHTFYSPLFRAISILLLTPLNLFVGFLIIRRVPGNVVGPLLIIWAGTVAYHSVRIDINPFLFAIFSSYDILLGWLALFLMIMHFPDGKIYPAKASNWTYIFVGITLLIAILVIASPANLQGSDPPVPNPFHLAALQPQADNILRLGVLLLSPILVMTLLSPVLRYRKGAPLERQQIKWLALFAGSVAIYSLLALMFIPLLTGGQVMNSGTGLVGVVFSLSVGLFPPIAIGVAVLRYRLWDIDIIIRKTAVYSILTVALTSIYFLSVVGLQEIAQAVIGHASPVATVLSTLVIAALFTPLRRGIQSSIDRRFYRKKYIAEQVMEGFSKTLRNEVDLDELKMSIVEVVEGTMQPDHISLWLRDGEKAKQH